MSEKLIIALDVTTLREALALARQLRGVITTVKVGSALFTAEGPQAIVRLRRLGFEVMLDLKFFDIPSTVELSCRAAVRHRARLITIHASGDPAMLSAAVRGIHAEARRRRIARPQLLGVTVLTSVRRSTSSSIKRRVMRLAATAVAAGCDGVVASAQEAALLRARFGRRLKIACPGIRPRSASRGDQQRVMSPSEALAAGADWLIVGRPITGAANPRRAAVQLLQAMEENAC
ncbi:MAG: orotidine-5'-phosphate decarboxylase [Candidatus Omnitrophica bacterium]|nr:orotidine-5'-phosphate decarboxylase [Candidatus Omnitrophota bacterium]